jgi:hypothetical protein
VRGRHEDDEAIGAQAQRSDARVRGLLRGHGDVGRVIEDELQHVRRVADLEREGEPGVAALQLGEQRHDVRRAVGGDPQVAAGEGARAGKQRQRFVLRREQARGDREQALAKRRQRQRPAAPIEEGDAMRRLERADLRR